MYKHSILFIIIFSIFYFISCSDESSDNTILDASDIVIYDVSIDIADTTSIKDYDEVKDSTYIADSITDIKDVELLDTNPDNMIFDISIEDRTNQDSTETITDITDIEIFDIITDEIISDTYSDTPTDTNNADISDSGTDTSSDIEVLQPLINEMMIEPNFSDIELGQYVEIYNPNDFSIDINGYRVKTDSREFAISNNDCETIINARSFIVIGATKDPLKNSYAKVKCEWKGQFTLTNASYIELIRPDNVSVEKIDLTKIQKKKGASLERHINNFEISPSLITFLDDTGLYNGDRGSPAKKNYNLILKEILSDSEPLNDRIESENAVHRYPATLAAGDIIAFYADVDRINGDLKLFASLLDSNNNFITPDKYISDITYDFFIYHIIKNTGTYYFQIQPDFFTKFNPANIKATYFRADGLKVNKDFVEIKVGEQYQIETYATFSQNKDLKDFLIDKTLPDYSSNDPMIADVSKSGLITAKNIGSVTLYIDYNYLGNPKLSTSMVVNVYNQPSNETCDTAIDATNGISTYASTIGANDDYNPEKCIFSLFSGGDIVYYVDADPNAEYEVVVIPYGSFDPMIYVLDDCSKNECLYGTVLNGAGEIEKLNFKNETFSKKRFYIVIDGELMDDGSFELQITKK